jgi:hypothetical protein
MIRNIYHSRNYNISVTDILRIINIRVDRTHREMSLSTETTYPSTWYNNLSSDSKIILSEVKDKYPSLWSLQEIMENLIKDRDDSAIERILAIDSYLPLNWNLLDDYSFSLHGIHMFEDKRVVVPLEELLRHNPEYYYPVSDVKKCLYNFSLENIKKVLPEYIKEYGNEIRLYRNAFPSLSVVNYLISEGVDVTVLTGRIVKWHTEIVPVQDDLYYQFLTSIDNDDLDGFINGLPNNEGRCDMYKYVHGKILRYIAQMKDQSHICVCLRNEGNPSLYPRDLYEFSRELMLSATYEQKKSISFNAIRRGYVDIVERFFPVSTWDPTLIDITHPCILPLYNM